MERTVSWGLGVLAYVAPPIWAYFEKGSVYSKYLSRYGYVSGTSLLTVDILAWIGAVLLSGLALGFAWFISEITKTLTSWSHCRADDFGVAAFSACTIYRIALRLVLRLGVKVN